MKIAHIADLHCCRENAEEALTSLRFLAEHIKKSPVDIVCIAGDTWDASMLNTEASGFNRFIDAIRNIADIAPVVAVSGTPAHDTDGSLEVFRKITCKHGITVLEPGQAYFLATTSSYSKVFAENELRADLVPYSDALIFGIPEPRKKYLLSGTSAGKDETEEAIRAAMHKMCYLLAAKRREYSDIPCLVLYHGEVAGTVYQNNMTVERGTGIAITIDDLADIGADYYALGHIHKPQKVGNINAYYAGSIYPKNFGETHQASFKVVDVESTIENQRLVSVSTVDFPHPQNVKIELKYPNMAFPEMDLCAGKKVWVEITCEKDKRRFIDAGAIMNDIRFCGALEGSRVTISDIPVETVRAAEITGVATPEQKFEVWAKNSNIQFSESHTKKIESLSVEITKFDVKTEGAWELVSVRLKGSVGIMLGINQEEIALDFGGYESGLIALSGANGKGKTTLLENCHPFPQLFTRKGKLQDHFTLKDSFREVIYRNHVDGSKWKFLIQIDGQNKSGSCKYFIFKQSGDTWEPLSGVDGNLKPYEEALGTIFGPVELFLRTAFITQRVTKNLPDITDATAGEKKALFVALAGIDYLQEFSDTANEKAKQEAAKTHDAGIKMQMLQESIAKKPEEEQSLKDSEADFQTQNTELTEITKQGKTAKEEVERFQKEWNAELVRQQQENGAKSLMDVIKNDLTNLNMNLGIETESIKNKAQHEKDIAEYDALQKIIDTETATKQKFIEAVLKEQQEYAKVKATYDSNLKALETERDALCDKRGSMERLIAVSETNIKIAEKDEEVERQRLLEPILVRKAEYEKRILEAENNIKLYERDSTEITEDCPTCEQALPEEKIAELKAFRDECLQKIENEKTSIKELDECISEIANETTEAMQKAAAQRDTKIAKEKADIEEYKGEVTVLNIRLDEIGMQVSELAFDEPTKPEAKPFDDTKLKGAQDKQQRVNIARARAALIEAQGAAVRIEEMRKQIAEKNKLFKEKEVEYEKIWKHPDVGVKIKANFDDATKKRTELTEKYTCVKSSIARTEAVIDNCRKAIAEIAKKEYQYFNLKEESQTAASEGQEWELIAKAFSKDGIQALELDALAPGISEIANRILESAYGDRFKIEIETTRIGGSGKKTKQIEDFIINVMDQDTGGEPVPLEMKSGGESVWIKRAIYDAFSVIRKRNTNFSFLTCFQDEADGALDSAAKTAYCRMLEASHAESKLRHTIIITHSNEAKAMIDQKIDMEVLASKGAA